jgi:phage terminase large subunit-like protein
VLILTNHHPGVMNWSVGNAVAIMDPAGNRKLDKERDVPH